MSYKSMKLIIAANSCKIFNLYQTTNRLQTKVVPIMSMSISNFKLDEWSNDSSPNCYNLICLQFDSISTFYNLQKKTYTNCTTFCNICIVVVVWMYTFAVYTHQCFYLAMLSAMPKETLITTLCEINLIDVLIPLFLSLFI